MKSSFESDQLPAMLHDALSELSSLEQAAAQLSDIYEVKYSRIYSSVLACNRQLESQNCNLIRLCESGFSKRAACLDFFNWFNRVGLNRKIVYGFASALVLGIGSIAIGLASGYGKIPIIQLSSAKSSVIKDATPDLILRSEGVSWVEVQDLYSHNVLFMGSLNPGDRRVFSLRRAIRVRSGRPDLLFVEFDGRPPMAFGQAYGLGWRVFKRAAA